MRFLPCNIRLRVRVDHLQASWAHTRILQMHDPAQVSSIPSRVPLAGSDLYKQRCLEEHFHNAVTSPVLSCIATLMRGRVIHPHTSIAEAHDEAAAVLVEACVSYHFSSCLFLPPCLPPSLSASLCLSVSLTAMARQLEVGPVASLWLCLCLCLCLCLLPCPVL